MVSTTGDELGELARELHIGVALGRARELGLDRLVARQQRVEFASGRIIGAR